MKYQILNSFRIKNKLIQPENFVYILYNNQNKAKFNG